MRKVGRIEKRPDGGLLLVEPDGLPWRIDCDVAQHMRFIRLLGERVIVSGYPYSETWFSIVSILLPAEPDKPGRQKLLKTLYKVND